MEHIQITPQTADRIMGNIAKERVDKTSHSKVLLFPVRSKKVIGLVATLALVMVGGLCWYQGNPSMIEPPVQVVQNIITFDDLEEMKSGIAFLVESPTHLPKNMEPIRYAYITQSIAEIKYSDGEERITYRTSQSQEDISGIYTSYDVITQITDGAIYGDESGYYLAKWQEGGYTFSIHTTTPLAKDMMVAMISSIQ